MRGRQAWGIVLVVFLAASCVMEGPSPPLDPECPPGTRTAYADEILHEDETWVRWCGPYTVDGVLRIEQAATLRVEAGVEIRLAPAARIVVGETTAGALEAIGQPEVSSAGKLLSGRRPVSFVAGGAAPWGSLIVAVHGHALLREVDVRGTGGSAALAVQGGSLRVDGAAFADLAGSALAAMTRYGAPPRPTDPPEWGPGALQVTNLSTDGSGEKAALRVHWSHVSSLARMLDLVEGQRIEVARRSDEVIGSMTFLRQRVPYRVGSGWGPGPGGVWTLHAGVTLEVSGGAEGHLDLRAGRTAVHGLPDLPVEVRSPGGEKGSWRGVLFTWGQLEYKNLIVTGGGAAWPAAALATGPDHSSDNHASLVAWGAPGPPQPGLSAELLVRKGRGSLGIYPCGHRGFTRGGARLEAVDDPGVYAARYCF